MMLEAYMKSPKGLGQPGQFRGMLGEAGGSFHVF
jgi:hypothetical protein